MEGIGEIDVDLAGTFFGAAIENERALALAEEQKKNYMRVIISDFTCMISVNKHSTFESITLFGGSLCSYFYRVCNEIFTLNTI